MSSAPPRATLAEAIDRWNEGRPTNDPTCAKIIQTGERSYTWQVLAAGTAEFGNLVGTAKSGDNGNLPWLEFVLPGYEIEVNSLSYSHASTTSIGVAIEFYDPAISLTDEAKVFRILSPTAEGGSDANKFIWVPERGFRVPRNDGGLPWSVWFRTNKAAAALNADAWASVTFTLRPINREAWG